MSLFNLVLTDFREDASAFRDVGNDVGGGNDVKEKLTAIFDRRSAKGGFHGQGHEVPI
jgi:hypothetical protein